jgi:hypothetical protein
MLAACGHWAIANLCTLRRRSGFLKQQCASDDRVL